MKEKLSLLLVEDDSFWADEILESLDINKFEITYCSDLQSALDTLSKKQFDLITLDLQLPDSIHPLNTLGKVTSLESISYVPIIVITSLADDKLIAKAMDLGVQDFIIKGEFNETVLIHSMKLAIHRIESKLKADQNKSLKKVINNLKSIERKLKSFEIEMKRSNLVAIEMKRSSLVAIA